MTTDLNDDPQWARFSKLGSMCAGCGQTHVGLFDLVCGYPAFWEGSSEKLPNSEVLGSETALTEDFCVIKDEHFFVRGVLQLPLVGAQNTFFGFGVWATLSKTNFNLYVDTFDGGKQGHLGPWFGWFSNWLEGYPDTINLKAHVVPRDGRKRPLIELEPTDHPLAVEQRDGITFDRILELYALYGHDLRPALQR